MDLSRYKPRIFQFIKSLFIMIPIFLNTPIQSYASETVVGAHPSWGNITWGDGDGSNASGQ